jgi:hypothetical protein
MVISEQSCGRTNQMTGSIDMLLQTFAIALAAALGASYWRGAGQQGRVGGGRAAR